MRIGQKGTLCFFVFWAVWSSGETQLTVEVKPVYRYRADGQPGREAEIAFEGVAPGAITQANVSWSGQTGVAECAPVKDTPLHLRVLLPPGLGERRAEDVVFTVNVGGAEIRQTFKVPAMRHWTVYLYNHSHVDIGYSVTQETAEFLHTRNIEEGIKLADATRGAPDGSRFQWNPEVTWPIERFWRAATPERREWLLRAVREGLLAADASYVHINTSTCSDEELFHLFGFGHELSLRSGVRVETMQQVDVPGVSWGLLPVMAQLGVRYLMMWPNTCRAGHAHDGVDGQPFWWVGPDGVSKVLVLQPGCYANSGSMKKGGETGRPWFGQREQDRIPAVIRTGQADVNFTSHVANLEAGGYPYDFAVLSWSLWDNSPPDADVPDAVRAWNAEVAFPHIVMAGGTAIMREIESKYGKQFPEKRGDFTEYWTDGLGSAARLIAGNRNAKERLVQAETLWALLRPGKPAPRESFDDAWRYVMLGSEHTWCAENPAEPYFQEAIWEGKQRYFREADERSRRLLDDALAPATDTSRGALGPAEGPAEGGVAVFNTHAWAHGGLVALKRSESRRGDRVTDETGGEILSQRLASGELAFLASDVPAFGVRHFHVTEGACGATSACRISEGVLENGALRVGVDLATGCVTQLVVLATGRDYADPSKDGGLNAFRWMPGDSDDAKPDCVTKAEIVEHGPLVVELRIQSEAPGCRSVSRSVRLVGGQPWVEFFNVVDKLPLEAKDGIHFGFGFRVADPVVRVDIPWGIMRVETDQLPEANRNWLALQRWLDVSCALYGATWCSLDAPIFECGGMTANQTGTWQGERKPWLRRLEPSAAVYSWVMNNHWFTNFPLTQEGPVTFRYRVLPHGAFSATDANRFGLEQAQPLVHVAAKNKPDVRPPVALDNPRVTVTILRPEADGETLTARLRSLSDQPEDVHVSYPAAAPVSATLCDAAGERPIEAGAALKLPSYGCASISIKYSASRHAASAP